MRWSRALFVGSVFACGCGGSVTENGPVDASTVANAVDVEATEAASSDVNVGATDDTSSSAGTPCTNAAQCPGGFFCGYLMFGGCDEPGSCQPVPTGCGDGPICACDGTVVYCAGETMYGAAPTDRDPPIPPFFGGPAASAWCLNTVNDASSDVVVERSVDGSSDGESNAKGSSDANADAYSGSCEIDAASYDQSCTVDTDCSEVTSTDYCSSSCLCGGSPISVTGLAEFNVDVAKTPLGSGAIHPGYCACPLFGRVCCVSGTCKVDELACDKKDTLPACADAGGTCSQNVVQCGQGEGPSDSCALANETCCLN
ncbi:MAG: hypothetical protein ABSC94_24920 [Polyangiaceae bacterium]